MSGHVEVETRDRVATIWLDRPDKRNAMTLEMWAAVGDAAVELANDRSVRVVVLRGRGEHFCAGADVGSIGAGDDYAGTNRRAEDMVAAVPKPTIAFLSGACIGGGAQLAFACDIRIADTTLRAGVTPSRMGIVYPGHSVERLTRALGPSAAKHLLFSAELIDAERALRIGFVDEVHEPDDARRRLADFTTLLAQRRSALTQQASKAMVDAAATGTLAAAESRRWFAEMDRSGDPVEGVSAFLEKRDPTFGWDGRD